MIDAVQSVLLTLAEISIAYVGFAAIVGALTSKSQEWTDGTRILFRSMIDTGLVNVFLCLIPNFLYLLSLEGSTLWLSSSIITTAMVTVVFIVRMVQIRRIVRTPLAIGRWLLIPLSVTTIAVYSVNAGFWETAGPYVLATGINILLSTVQFLAVISTLFPVRSSRCCLELCGQGSYPLQPDADADRR